MSEGDFLLRYKDLRAHGIPWTRKHVRALIEAKIFPEPIRLGLNTIVWRTSQIENFIASRPAAGLPRAPKK